MRLRRAVIAGAVALAAAFLVPRPAAAQDHPPFAPTRDAAVTYRVTSAQAGGSTPPTLRIATQAATGLTRFELPGRGYAVLDRKTNQAVVVIEAQHAWLQLPQGASGTARRLTLNAGMQFTRQGHDTVAGMGCTVWDVRSDDGSATICMTNDGVLLRGAGASKDGRMKGSIEATAVSLAAQPGSLFVPPDGYRKMDFAELLQGMQGHPAAR